MLYLVGITLVAQLASDYIGPLQRNDLDIRGVFWSDIVSTLIGRGRGAATAYIAGNGAVVRSPPASRSMPGRRGCWCGKTASRKTVSWRQGWRSSKEYRHRCCD